MGSCLNKEIPPINSDCFIFSKCCVKTKKKKTLKIDTLDDKIILEFPSK